MLWLHFWHFVALNQEVSFLTLMWTGGLLHLWYNSWLNISGVVISASNTQFCSCCRSLLLPVFVVLWWLDFVVQVSYNNHILIQSHWGIHQADKIFEFMTYWHYKSFPPRKTDWAQAVSLILYFTKIEYFLGTLAVFISGKAERFHYKSLWETLHNLSTREHSQVYLSTVKCSSQCISFPNPLITLF